MTNSKPLLYVGNLPYDIRDNDIVTFLLPHKVRNVRIVFDRDTGRPRGFAFVEMETEEAALGAIRDLHQTQLGGRRAVVRAANERKHFDTDIRARGW